MPAPTTSRPRDSASSVASWWASTTGCRSAGNSTAVPRVQCVVVTASALRSVSASGRGRAMRLSPTQTPSNPRRSAWVPCSMSSVTVGGCGPGGRVARTQPTLTIGPSPVVMAGRREVPRRVQRVELHLRDGGAQRELSMDLARERVSRSSGRVGGDVAFDLGGEGVSEVPPRELLEHRAGDVGCDALDEATEVTADARARESGDNAPALGDASARVQCDRVPDDFGVVVVVAVGDEEVASGVGVDDLERLAARREGGQADVVENGGGEQEVGADVRS